MRVPSGNMRWIISYNIGKISALKDLDHEVRIDHTDHLPEACIFYMRGKGVSYATFSMKMEIFHHNRDFDETRFSSCFKTRRQQSAISCNTLSVHQTDHDLEII